MHNLALAGPCRILYGNDLELFQIKTSLVVFAKVPDLEAPSNHAANHMLVLRCQDNGEEVEAHLHVTIAPQNEHKPVVRVTPNAVLVSERSLDDCRLKQVAH